MDEDDVGELLRSLNAGDPIPIHLLVFDSFGGRELFEVHQLRIESLVRAGKDLGQVAAHAVGDAVSPAVDLGGAGDPFREARVLPETT